MNHEGKFPRKTNTLETWTSTGSILNEDVGNRESVEGSGIAGA